MRETTDAAGPRGFAIDRARAADVSALAGLIGSLFEMEPDFAANRPAQERGLGLLLRDAERAAIFVAREAPEAAPIGMVTVQLLASTAEGALSGLVEDMVVARDFRGQGLGTRLLRAAEGWCRAQGATRIQLLVDEANAGAMAFYERLGVAATRMVCRRKLLQRDD